MYPSEGTRQKRLQRIACEWGRDVREHSFVYPVFTTNYRVNGVLAYSLGAEPVWYPGSPAAVEKRRLRFKAPFAEDGPLAARALHPDTFQGAYLCDPWRIIAEAVRGYTQGRALTPPVDIFEYEVRGQPLIDVVYERPLHRVRGFVVRRGIFYRTRTLSVLEIPALAEALKPPAKPKRAWHRSSRPPRGPA